MQLTRRFGATATFVLIALFAGAPGAAEIEDQEALYRFEFFSDSDDVQVFSNAGGYELTLSGDSRLAIGWNHERVVVPGVAAPPGSQEAVDSISGASRPIASSADPFSDFTKIRNQLDTTIRHRGFSAGYYLSDESDYFAQQVSGGAERSILGDHLTLAAGTSYGWDRIEPLDDEDTSASADEKTTFHGHLVGTQILTQTTIAQFGIEWNRVEGLQHNPYRNVYVAGSYVPELHPDTRVRRDFFVKVNQYLANRSSAKISYKYYTDDWGIDSHTLGAKLSQYVSDGFVVRYRYRFYDQSAATFYRDDYVEIGGVNGFRTGDYRMSDFTAHLFGTKVTWNLGRGPIAIPALDGIHMNLEYERYFNSNNFSANIFESGLALSF